MAASGWGIAMHRVDAEYDIPQNDASSLVRKIATNWYRLPAICRAYHQYLPNEVVARIEKIVRDAYLEAG